MTATLDKWTERAARAQQNRVDMPLVTAFADELRAALGPTVTLRYAHENGITYGKRGPKGVQASEAWGPLPQKKRRERKPSTGDLLETA